MDWNSGILRSLTKVEKISGFLFILLSFYFPRLLSLRVDMFLFLY